MTTKSGLAAGMRDAFRNSKRKYDERNLPLPENEYMGRLQQCAVKKARQSENHYIGLAFYVSEGEEKGRIAYDNSLILIPEKTDFIIQFFGKFGFDIDIFANESISDEELFETIGKYCDIINQAAPTVRFRVKHWKDDNTRANIYLNKVIDDVIGEGNDFSSDQQPEDEQTYDDGLDGKSKHELKEIIFADDSPYDDISPKFIASHTEEEIVARMREIVAESLTTGGFEDGIDGDDSLRQRLLALCESQLPEEDKELFNQESTVEELTELLKGYSYETTGDYCLTEDERDLLIEIGLEDCINPEEETPPPPPPPPAPRSRPKPAPKAQAKTVPNRKPAPAKGKGNRR